MFRLTLPALTLALPFTLAACGSDAAPSDTTATDTTVLTDTVATDSDAAADSTTDPDAIATETTVAETTADVEIDTGPPKPGLGIDYSATPPGAAPRFAPSASDWLAVGWPSDRWLTNGHLDLSGFPRGTASLVDTYLDFGEKVLDGFGLNGAVYFALDTTTSVAIDDTTLPDPAATLDTKSPIQLVDVTPASAHRGEHYPLVFAYREAGLDDFHPLPLLALRPVYGFPLVEGDTYCAIVTRAVKDADGHYLQIASGFADALATAPYLAPLRAWLPDSPLRDDDIAVASCFTAQHATTELVRIASYIDDEVPPEVDTIFEPGVWGEFQGTYTAPNFQAGTKPYTADGDIRFDTSGAPIVQADEELRFLLLTPTDKPMPDSGWPIVLYGHGTGGDYESCRGDTREAIADGLAVLCIDQPLHGPRGPAGTPLTENEEVIYSFNFVNPYAGRSNFRQAAIDTLQLTRMIEVGRFDLPASATKAHQPLTLDPDKVFFFGHSHGGLAGTMSLAVDRRIKAGVISGMSGVIVETILLRKDPVDLGSLAAAILGIDQDALDSFHPTMTLIQALVDATDPVNYTRLWLNPPGDIPSKSVFVTQGTLDAASPSIGNDAACGAGRIPQLEPIAKISDPHVLRGMTPEHLDLVDNVTGSDGIKRTAAQRQWQGGSHFTAFTMADARAMWRHFLSTAAYGEAPEIALGTIVNLVAHTPVSPADDCTNVASLPTDHFPIEIRSDTALAAANSSATDCPTGVLGAAGRDLSWKFRPPVAGKYRFRIALQAAIDKEHPRFGPDLLYVGTACGALAGAACTGAKADGSLDLDLPANTDYFVTVDGSTVTDVGPFALVVEQLCQVLSCEGRECGNYGCGNCGSCGGGEMCDASGQCQPRLGGDSCASAIEIGALPFSFAGDTRKYANDVGYVAGNCPDFPFTLGTGSGDVAFHFTAPAAATYDFALDGDYDVNLWIAQDCANAANTCLGANRTGGRNAKVSRAMTAGESVYVFADGASNTGNSAGHFALTAQACQPQCAGRTCGSDGCGGTCGTCADTESCIEKPGDCIIPYDCPATSSCKAVPGDRCGSAFPVTALPFSEKRDTANFYSDYGYASGWCPGVNATYGFGASDVVYAFTAPKTGLFRFGLDTGYPIVFDANLYIVQDCSDVEETCLVADERDRNERIYRNFTEGESAYVVVDGWSDFGNQTGTYTIDIRECVPSCENRVCGGDGCNGTCGSACPAQQYCGGDGQCRPVPGLACETPRGVGTLPWHEDFATTDYAPARDNTCAGAATGAASPDVTYRFEAPKAGTYTFRVSGDFAVQLSAYGACAGECLATGPTLDLDMTEKQVVFLTVDGIDNGGGVSGHFTFSVANACAPQCDGKTCGPDGCGGSCGTCAFPADICRPDQVCTDPVTLVGVSCTNPLVIGALPFAADGDTTGGVNSYVLDEGQCPGFVSKGMGSNDNVWRLTADEAGHYDLELDPDGWDAFLYVLGDCSTPATSCLDASDAQTREHVSIDLTAGQTVFVMIDGVENIRNDAGKYHLAVTRRAP